MLDCLFIIHLVHYASSSLWFKLSVVTLSICCNGNYSVTTSPFSFFITRSLLVQRACVGLWIHRTASEITMILTQEYLCNMSECSHLSHIQLLQRQRHYWNGLICDWPRALGQKLVVITNDCQWATIKIGFKKVQYVHQKKGFVINDTIPSNTKSTRNTTKNNNRLQIHTFIYLFLWHVQKMIWYSSW